MKRAEGASQKRVRAPRAVLSPRPSPRMHEVRCVAAPQSRLSGGLGDSFLPRSGCEAFLVLTSLNVMRQVGDGLEVSGGNRWVDLAVRRCGMRRQEWDEKRRVREANVQLLTSDFSHGEMDGPSVTVRYGQCETLLYVLFILLVLRSSLLGAV